MAEKHDLKHSIIQTLKHHRDGSFKTQANRKERLLLIAEQLMPKHQYATNEDKSIKIRINESVAGNELCLKGGWCKDGRLRTIKI